MTEIAYMYLFVRADLSQAQQIVQVAHAVDKLHTTHRNSHAVLFHVKNEHDLLMAAEHLIENGIEHALFYEPDITSHTAMATEPIFGDARDLFKKFKMVR